MSRTLFIAVSFLLISFSLSSESQKIPIITYHTHPPFIQSDKQGLSYELADYLNEKSKGTYSFEVVPMSRPRVNSYLENNRVAIVPWVNPAWFNDTNETVYNWTDGYLMEDGYAIVSSNSNKIVYNGPQSISSLRFGGIKGHNYIQTKTLESDASIKRVDSDNHMDNINKILYDRIDFCIIPISSISYLVNKNQLNSDLFISYDNQNKYLRRILVSGENDRLFDFISDITIHMDRDNKWTSIKKIYIGFE